MTHTDAEFMRIAALTVAKASGFCTAKMMAFEQLLAETYEEIRTAYSAGDPDIVKHVDGALSSLDEVDTIRERENGERAQLSA